MTQPKLEFVPCNLCGENAARPVFTRKVFLHSTGGEFKVVKCGHCGLFYVNPRPSAEGLEEYYPKNYYSYQSSNPVRVKKDFKGIRGWLRCQALTGKSLAGKFLRYFLVVRTANWRWFYAANPLTVKKNMLEVGCGSGETLRFFKDFGWEVTGIEPGGAVIPGRENDVRILHQDFLESPVPQNQYDLIWLSHVFEHFTDPKKALKKLYGALKSDGEIYMQIPVVDSPVAWVSLSTNPVWDVPRHLYFFTLKTFRALAEGSGFSCEVLCRISSAQTLTSIMPAGVPRLKFMLWKVYAAILAFFCGNLNQGECLSLRLQKKTHSADII